MGQFDLHARGGGPLLAGSDYASSLFAGYRLFQSLCCSNANAALYRVTSS
jgi:hypothetical protein